MSLLRKHRHDQQWSVLVGRRVPRILAVFSDPGPCLATIVLLRMLVLKEKIFMEGGGLAPLHTHQVRLGPQNCCL